MRQKTTTCLSVDAKLLAAAKSRMKRGELSHVFERAIMGEMTKTKADIEEEINGLASQLEILQSKKNAIQADENAVVDFNFTVRQLISNAPKLWQQYTPINVKHIEMQRYVVAQINKNYEELANTLGSDRCLQIIRARILELVI